MHNLPVQIRLIAEEEYQEAFAVLRLLRDALDIELFNERLKRQQTAGYELHGAFTETLIGLIGFRPVETMARGFHMHVDDLVVASSFRKLGVGTQLLRFAESVAHQRSMTSVFLDSRIEIMPFYSNLGYSTHTAILMRKQLKPA